jgi:hypothetical protein
MHCEKSNHGKRPAFALGSRARIFTKATTYARVPACETGFHNQRSIAKAGEKRLRWRDIVTRAARIWPVQ